MPERAFRLLSLFFLAAASFTLPISSAAAAPDAAVSPEYQIRTAELLDLLKGSQGEERFFASSFLDAIPLNQFRATLVQLKTQYGEPLFVKRVIPAGDLDGTVEIEFEKATLAMRLVLDRTAPYPVIGLQVTGANMHSDSIGKIKAEMTTLPGRAGFQIAEISGGRPVRIDGLNDEHAHAVGSAFKLYVLASLSRQIGEREKSWRDIIPLSRKSLPSGVLQNWPENTPLTVQTLATLMISISDNTATDLLINAIGRADIERTVRRTGHASPETIIPFLTTLEAFALKMPANDNLRQRFETASDSEQEQMLETEAARLGRSSVSITNLANAPRHIETIEWFSSPSDMTNLLHHIRTRDDPVVRNILAINPIIPPSDAKRWNYLGGKGGSEPGVISFAFVGEARSGKSYAVSGSWNNAQAPVDNARFQSLINRLLNIMAER